MGYDLLGHVGASLKDQGVNMFPSCWATSVSARSYSSPIVPPGFGPSILDHNELGSFDEDQLVAVVASRSKARPRKKISTQRRKENNHPRKGLPKPRLAEMWMAIRRWFLLLKKIW